MLVFKYGGFLGGDVFNGKFQMFPTNSKCLCLHKDGDMIEQIFEQMHKPDQQDNNKKNFNDESSNKGDKDNNKGV